MALQRAKGWVGIGRTYSASHATRPSHPRTHAHQQPTSAAGVDRLGAPRPGVRGPSSKEILEKPVLCWFTTTLARATATWDQNYSTAKPFVCSCFPCEPPLSEIAADPFSRRNMI